jgi:undecaprenyl-diphosphatase
MDAHVWQAVLLGIIQGLTEFLPVSSSGHLAIAQHYLPGFKQPGILLDVLLHFGTLVAVALYFYRDFKDLVLNVAVGARHAVPLPEKPGWRLLIGLVVASVPTAAIGLVLEDRVEKWFESLSAVGAALIGTAVLLALGEFAARRREKIVGARHALPLHQDPGIGQSLLIGVFQGLAVIPGLSRSGSTISAGLLCGVEGVTAARFSFLLSIPAVGGATAITLVKHLGEIQAGSAGEIAGYVLGPLMAAGVGYAGIGLMMRVMKRARLSYFAVYCALLGLATMLVATR